MPYFLPQSTVKCCDRYAQSTSTPGKPRRNVPSPKSQYVTALRSRRSTLQLLRVLLLGNHSIQDRSLSEKPKSKSTKHNIVRLLLYHDEWEDQRLNKARSYRAYRELESLLSGDVLGNAELEENRSTISVSRWPVSEYHEGHDC